MMRSPGSSRPRKLRYLFIGISTFSLFSIARSFSNGGISWFTRRSSTKETHPCIKLCAPYPSISFNRHRRERRLLGSKNIGKSDEEGDTTTSSTTRNSNNTRLTNDIAAIKPNTDTNPLDQIRVFRQLPLRKACFAILIYLSIGTIAFKGVFPEPSWSVLDAVYFSSVCLSTIGYGDLVPSTTGGKLFAAIFGMSGILLWSSAIVSVGTRLVQSETKSAEKKLVVARKNAILELYERHMPDILKRIDADKDEDETSEEGQDEKASSDAENLSWPLAPHVPPKKVEIPGKRQTLLQWFGLVRTLIKPLMVIVLGGTLIGRLEGWNLCDSLYFSLITASTIGFGDFSPSTVAGQIVAIILIPVLLAAAGAFFARVGVFAIRNRSQKLFASTAERAEWLTQEQANEMDLNQDGKVCKSEYILYMLTEAGIVSQEESQLLGEQFERFDVTRSGFIEAEDLKAMKKFRERLQRERIKQKE